MDSDITFESLVNLVDNITITYNPFDDTYKIMKLGDMVYKAQKHQQWTVCNDLYENISKALDTELPDFSYSRDDLKAKIDSFLEKNVSPGSTENDILEYIRSVYISNTDYNYSFTSVEDIVSSKKYLEFMNSLRYVLKKVYNNYVPEWKKIEDKFTTLHYRIEDKFKHLQHEEEYVNFTNKIFGLMDEVDIEVKAFYKYSREYINSGRLEKDYNMCFNIVMARNKIDDSTVELLKSTIYLTNLTLNKLNVSIKTTKNTISSIIL